MLGRWGSQTRLAIGEKQIPLMGMLAAFIFAAQAINFLVAPAGWRTGGHHHGVVGGGSTHCYYALPRFVVGVT